ncbi:TPA: glycosyltransferase [Streptococcus suis]|nr:glycosyltransferase [Streptococcus suis]
MKIMIICPHFRGIEYGVVKSFERLGHEVHPLYFNVGMDKCHYYQRIKLKLHLSINEFLLKEKRKFNERVLAEYNRILPEYVYVIQGRWMSEKTIDTIKQKSFISLYLWDMVSLFPEMVSTFKHYDIIYSFDNNDTRELLKQGINARYKPSGYDQGVYHKINSQKKYDISFIGAMYSDRVVLLKKLIDRFPDIRWGIYGEIAPIRMPAKWIKWRLSPDYKYFKNKNIEKAEVNRVYNESRIVLSIVRSNQKDGWSARLPEILGAGAFQVTNWFESVEQEFGECLALYKSLDELVEVIDYYLNHDDVRERIAEVGYKKAVSQYSDDVLNQFIIEDYMSFKGGTNR